MNTIRVRPGDQEIRERRVALWDQDPAHIAANADWRTHGGAFIAGDPTRPDLSYLVADTEAVQLAIRQRRLVALDDVPDTPPAPPTHTTTAEGMPESGVLPSEEPPAGSDVLPVGAVEGGDTPPERDNGEQPVVSTPVDADRSETPINSEPSGAVEETPDEPQPRSGRKR